MMVPVQELNCVACLEYQQSQQHNPCRRIMEFSPQKKYRTPYPFNSLL